jgi:hypothetical protein
METVDTKCPDAEFIRQIQWSVGVDQRILIANALCFVDDFSASVVDDYLATFCTLTRNETNG